MDDNCVTLKHNHIQELGVTKVRKVTRWIRDRRLLFLMQHGCPVCRQHPADFYTPKKGRVSVAFVNSEFERMLNERWGIAQQVRDQKGEKE